jgi:hypothetical protein
VGIEKLILEMNSLNFDQLNQLWSIIGGKYQPSVVYRMRMVTVDSVTDERKPDKRNRNAVSFKVEIYD